ncbi:uncharacterized protein BcabD6B2_31050 [Babesia caballi]|uniref:6-Cys domain-containing protein n=1 Tax=Babesia caballi TaxID=5871 RepID=A0AAV4LUZ5_BABCB|nr:hypothetical protein, conserved [Babesia caballi]
MVALRVLEALALASIALIGVGCKRHGEKPPFRIAYTFANEQDMRSNGVDVQEVAMDTVVEVIVSCGSNERDNVDGDFTLYPRKPKSRTLLPPEGDDLEEALSREQPLRAVIWSDNLNIHSLNDQGSFGYVKIRTTPHTVIMAHDPESASLNYACKYQPKDMSKPAIIRWVKIKFKYVYPMAYGCDSGNHMLFKNSMPQMEGYAQSKALFKCTLLPEPGMIFGVYCNPGERMVPRNCITDEELAKLDGIITPYKHKGMDMSKDKSYKAKSRVAFFQVSSTQNDKSYQFTCYCEDDSEKKKKIVIQNSIGKHLNLFNILNRHLETDTTYKRVETLSPGQSCSITVPKSTVVSMAGIKNINTLFQPEDPLWNVLNGTPDPALEETPIMHLLGYKGFKIGRQSTNKFITYTIDYDKDAVLVLKEPAAFIYYRWAAEKRDKKQQINSSIRVEYHVIPTDPYTYGCGVDSLDLFRSKNAKVEILEGGVTSCTVNPYVTSPVGFYCPKGYTLEPANCFTDMVHNDTGLVEPLSKYAPHARPIDSKHIRVVDFTAPHSLKHLVKYSNDQLSCLCVDGRGALKAVITLDLRSPYEDDVKAMYQVDETHQ